MCDRPLLTKDVFAVLKLYRRCKQFSALPERGGIFDQNANVMELLDAVDTEVEKWKAKRIEEERGEIMKQQMMRGLRA